ncbi:MAG: hypothetical protein GX851_08435, partial [Clostridiales bacterium]|nr:hypothetical protein [Clostridiales bacterium]
MDDKKEFDALETPENAADAVTPESAASSDTAPGKAPEDEKLSGELEKLKNMFRSELKMAREEVENESAQKESADILIQDVEPMENAPVPEEPAEEIPEDMLCECCGENMRDTSVSEDFQYCETCYATMKKYPYSWRYFLLAAAFIVCMVFSCWKFVIDADSYSYYKQGLAYEKERKITSAHEMYTKAMSAFDYDISRTQN